ncbi:WXG100 family type VII secretion target [Hamadaea sp. NPDC051192]|uniref:WXG100 family type VII secretion target n=1 Tax=Hamadaea sp. NPDC051192 TaxID=3154940 RepID=UPI0034298BE1
MSTDFGAYARAQLEQLIAVGDPAQVRAAADLWSDITRGLYSRAGDLEQQLRAFTPYWTGGAAERYQQMIADLIRGLWQLGDLARLVADDVYSAGEALQAARTGVLGRPDLDAVRLLTDLAQKYADLEALVPAPPTAAPFPAVNDLVAGTYPAQPTQGALFGGVYGAGLSAAAAALGGRFRTAIPQLVGPPSSGPTVPSPTPAPSTPGSPVPAVPAPAPTPVRSGGSAAGTLGRARGSARVPGFSPPTIPTGTMSSGTMSGGTVSGGSGVVDPVLSRVDANPVPAGVTAGTPAVTPGGGASGGAAGGGYFTPPVAPMTGGAGAGGDGSGGGRVPHWLTEPEPDVVFGVPLQAVAPVIGALG